MDERKKDAVFYVNYILYMLSDVSLMFLEGYIFLAGTVFLEHLSRGTLREAVVWLESGSYLWTFCIAIISGIVISSKCLFLGEYGKFFVAVILSLLQFLLVNFHVLWNSFFVPKYMLVYAIVFWLIRGLTFRHLHSVTIVTIHSGDLNYARMKEMKERNSDEKNRSEEKEGY